MVIKGIIDEDFVNYKKPSMYISFPTCSFKCCKEGSFPIEVCQNCNVAKAKNIEISAERIVGRYISNPITTSVVCCGLEPMDSFDDLKELIEKLRLFCDDDVVIFSGYKQEEIEDKVAELSKYKNVIIKFGRYVPNDTPHYDQVLGIELASSNQHAVRIS